MVLYGRRLSGYAQIAHYGSADNVDNFSDSFAVVAIICVMALIEIFICIMGVMASNERNSTYMQLDDPPIAPYHDQAAAYVPLDQVPRSNFARAGQIQGSFEAQAVPTVYQPMPQAVVQGGSPVMMPPTYTNQMGPAKAPVMLMPV